MVDIRSGWHAASCAASIDSSAGLDERALWGEVDCIADRLTVVIGMVEERGSSRLAEMELLRQLASRLTA